MKRLAFGLALLVAASFPGPVFAQTAGPVIISGAVKAPLTIDEALLKAASPTSISISFKTGKGVEQGNYTGVLLWDLIGKAGLVNEPGKNTELKHTILVTGEDGYAIAVSLGEIDPDYQGNKVILAYAGGTPPTSYTDLRLLIPGDAHGGRAVRDVAKIEVK